MAHEALGTVPQPLFVFVPEAVSSYDVFSKLSDKVINDKHYDVSELFCYLHLCSKSERPPGMQNALSAMWERTGKQSVRFFWRQTDMDKWIDAVGERPEFKRGSEDVQFTREFVSYLFHSLKCRTSLVHRFPNLKTISAIKTMPKNVCFCRVCSFFKFDLSSRCKVQSHSTSRLLASAFKD